MGPNWKVEQWILQQRIDELLDGRKTEKADKPSALKTIFTEEKIAQMKAKAIANRRKNIQSVEESHEYGMFLLNISVSVFQGSVLFPIYSYVCECTILSVFP